MKLTLSILGAMLLLLGSGLPRCSFVRASSVALQPRSQQNKQEPEDERGIVALDQSLRELTNPHTVLCIAVRPGDEDDGTLAYVHKKLGARAVMLFATRGEGDDSPTRSEIDGELGAIHTQEAIEAARIVGADVFFLNLRDIGYAKSADEVLSSWGHDEALSRMVRAIRSLRPDVIITNHDPRHGEGAEQAVTRLALEAFNTAGATQPAPEAGYEAWQPRRLFQRSNEPSGEVRIDLREYDRVRGTTYGQIGLNAHRRFLSRGADFDRLTPDSETVHYRLIASSPEERIKAGSGLLEGLELSENLSRSIAQPRVGGVGAVDSIATGERLIDALIEKLIEKRAEGTPDTLRERYGAEFVRVVRFTAALERALILALGLSLEVTVSDHVVVHGQKVVASLSLRNGGIRAFPVVFSAPERLTASDKNLTYKDSEVIGVGAAGVASKELEYEIAKDAALTFPHSAHLYDEDYYPVASSLPGSQPSEPFGSRLIVFAEVGLGQVNIRLAALARFDVASPVEISTIPFALIKDWSNEREISFPVRVRNRTPGKLAGALWVVPLALADDDYDPVHIAFAREDEEVTIKLKLRLPILKPPLAPDVLIEFRREKPALADPLASAKIAVK
ncbi:MAG TPA: PIG-L family deacetylase, partial [Blastocatellia bacterium]|nr:PIG-L family deacetylase [Blastocatellia bacterium]